MVRSGGKREEAWKRTSPIMTRSMTSQTAVESKPRKKTRRKRVEPYIKKQTLYEIPGTNGGLYSNLPPEEYIAAQNALEEYLSTHHLTKGPGHKQRQNDLVCRQYFSMIQTSRKEMADYELVETMPVTSIVDLGFWAHMNFKAKPKDADDSSVAVYFAELHVPRGNVTCLVKLDIDLAAADKSTYMTCGYCHMDPKELKKYPIGGCSPVYHPLDACSWVIGGRAKY